MNILNSKINSVKVGEIIDVQRYINKFFMYLKDTTGFTRRSFTEYGLQDHVKSIAKKCFQLKISSVDILQFLFKIALLLSRVLSEDLEKDSMETAVEEFIKILHIVTDYLVEYLFRKGFLRITSAL